MKDRMNVEELDSNMAITPLGDLDYQWFDPMDSDNVKLAGFYWSQLARCKHTRYKSEKEDCFDAEHQKINPTCGAKKDNLYRRMPINENNYLPAAVDSLADCCAGGQLRFITNSTRIAIDAEFANEHAMYHMTPAGQLGFDCYIGECGEMQFAATLNFDAKANKYCLPLFENIDKKMRTFTINFPLYNSKLQKLKIGIEPGSELTKPKDYAIEKPIVIYGTSITQGGCASRPGMCYTNILSREIDAEFINLGFSGSGKGEPNVMKTIASISDMELFVMDYEPNINDGIYENLEPSIDIIRSKHPLLPIIILSRIGYGQENIRPEGRLSATKRREFQKEFVAKRNQDGDQNISFVNGDDFFEDNPGEYAVDGCHPNDLGFYTMAKKLLPFIKDIMVNG